MSEVILMFLFWFLHFLPRSFLRCHAQTLSNFSGTFCALHILTYRTFIFKLFWPFWIFDDLAKIPFFFVPKKTKISVDIFTQTSPFLLLFFLLILMMLQCFYHILNHTKRKKIADLTATCSASYTVYCFVCINSGSIWAL